MSMTEIPSSYDRKAWTSKIWEGSIVYWEPVSFVTDINGKVPPLKLMYKPDKILEVRRHVNFEKVYEGRDYIYNRRTGNFTLPETIKLVKGRDYEVEEDGTIKILYKQMLHYTDWEYMHPKYKEGEEHDWLQMPSDHSRKFNLFNTISTSRIYVTYTHKDTWGDAFAPKDETKHLPRMTRMLKNKKDLNFVIFGDSIATGADGTGPDEKVIDVSNNKEIQYRQHYKPFTPSWAEMTVQSLREAYSYDNINKINKAAGSSHSTWGAKYADELVNPARPDVVAIAFGMNECSCPAEDYKERVIKILDTIHGKNPDCEFILVSSMEPNPELGHTYLADYEKVHYALQKERQDLHIAVCPLNSLFWAVIGKGKHFTDISSTNFNHPNDFLIRMYAMTMMATLGI